MKLFIDTWGWLTLRDRLEPRHQEVLAYYEGFRRNRGTPFTTDYVLDETFTLLFRRLSADLAVASMTALQKAVHNGHLRLEHMSADRFEETKALRVRFQDKLRISFTDLSSMVVMQEQGITDILTEDDHFTYVGMGFRKVP